MSCGFLTFGAHTRRGHRHVVNADAWLGYVPGSTQEFVHRGALFAVAEGVPPVGTPAASRRVLDQLFRAWWSARDRTPTAGLVGAIRAANADLHVLRDDELPDALARVLVIVATPTVLAVARVGTARAFLVRNGQVLCLTGEPVYSAGDGLAPAVGWHPDVGVQVAEIPLACGDAIFLCSTGVNDALNPPDLFRAAALPSAEHAATSLVDPIEWACGGEDRTVMAVRVEHLPAAPAITAGVERSSRSIRARQVAGARARQVDPRPHARADGAKRWHRQAGVRAATRAIGGLSAAAWVVAWLLAMAGR